MYAASFAASTLDAAPLTDAFDEWELLGFPLCSPFLLLTEDAKAIVRSGVLARDLPDHIGEVVTVVGHLVTVKETATAKGERMCFGCFVDLEGAWLDTDCATINRACFNEELLEEHGQEGIEDWANTYAESCCEVAAGTCVANGEY